MTNKDTHKSNSKKINKKHKKYEEAFLEYLWMVLSEKKDLLPLDTTRLIFIYALRDYLGEIISLRTFSAIATSLYYDFNKQSSFDANLTAERLGNLLDIASELDWNEKKEDKKFVNKELADLRDYYLENTPLLQK